MGKHVHYVKYTCAHVRTDAHAHASIPMEVKEMRN